MDDDQLRRERPEVCIVSACEEDAIYVMETLARINDPDRPCYARGYQYMNFMGGGNFAMDKLERRRANFKASRSRGYGAKTKEDDDDDDDDDEHKDDGHLKPKAVDKKEPYVTQFGEV